MLDRRQLGTFLFGGAVGALIGVLLAPRSGRELRGTFVSRLGEAGERGKESYYETQERLRERVSETRERPVRSGAESDEVRKESTELHGGEEPDNPRLPESSEELRRRIEETLTRLHERREKYRDV